MTLLNPPALWFLLLLPVPLLLARRRKPLRRQVVSNLYVWQKLVRRVPARPTLRRLHRNWLVALQMAFIAAGVAALSRPMVASRTARVALVFDVSGSMGAHDGAVTRFDLARQRARAILDELPARSRVQLIAASTTARTLGDYSVSDPSLARTLEALVPEGGAADLPAAISLATTTGASPANVYLFSDRFRPGTEEPGSRGIVWETVGHSADNLAVARLSARRLPLKPAEGEVLAEVRNYGARPRDIEVEIAQDGQPLAREAVQVAARGQQTIVVHATRIGDVIGARLVGDDALDVDNHRWTVVTLLERVQVALVGSGNVFLEKALAVNPAISLQPPAPSLQSPASNPDIAVCNGCTDLPQAARGILIVAPSTGLLNPGVLTIARPEHPLAASLDFGELFATPVTSRIAMDNGDVVLRAGGVPALIAYERDGRRIVELRVDIAASELTLSTAFPILIANAIDWLAARNENPHEVVSGEPLRWMLPNAPRAEDLSVSGPDNQPRHAQLLGARLTIADTAAPGIYRVRTPRTEQVFVVNAAVDTESDLIPTRTEEVTSTNVPVPRSEDQVPIAPALLLFALGLFAAEWGYRHGRTAWRLVIATFLLLSASGLAIVRRQAPISTVAVLDRSASVPVPAQERALARVNQLASTMRPGDRLGVVAFGADAVVELRPTERVHLPAIPSAIVDTGSDIAAGLRLAGAALPRGGSRRIVLVSDGRETTGSAEREAAYAAVDGIRIDVAEPDLLGVHRQRSAKRVVAPANVRIGEPFVVSVQVEGPAGSRGQLTVYRDEQLFSMREINIASDGTANAAFSDRYQQPGIHTYRALVRDPVDDVADQANVDAGSGAVVSVSGEPTVLYVSSSGGNLPAVIANAGFHVTHVVPESVPAVASALAAFDEVVLDDVPSERLSTSQMAAVATYVERSGGGLLLLGSSRTLSLAGYPTGPMGRILPIDLRPRAGSRAPSLGLVLVFDKSGSMADLAEGTPKIELARQAVMKVIDILPSTDSLGLIAFDANPTVVAPLAPAQDARAIAERLRAIEAGGSTLIAPATELALQWLRGADGATMSHRQILLVSDGRTSPDDAGRLRAAIMNAGVELSVVAIGPDADRDLLRALAEASGGRAYFPTNVGELPLIVAREAARSAGGTMVEERFVLRGAPHPVLAGIDRTLLPQLNGYVVSAAKPTATNILASHLDDPILSVWRAGLGRVGVFTADLGSTWSGSFRSWKDYGRVWAQSVRWLSRRVDDHSLRLAVTKGDSTTRLSVEAERQDGSFLNLDEARAVVRLPNGDSREIALSASAPGRYEATISTTAAGPYVISVSGHDRDGGTEHRGVQGFYWSADRERRSQDPDLALLTRLAEMTGGRRLGPADSPFSGTRPKAYSDISTWLVTAALGMFALDIATWRRLDVKRLRESFAAARRSAQKRVAA